MNQMTKVLIASLFTAASGIAAAQAVTDSDSTAGRNGYNSGNTPSTVTSQHDRRDAIDYVQHDVGKSGSRHVRIFGCNCYYVVRPICSKA
jgi:hypothetical protein